MMKCPSCERDYQILTEQALAVEKWGHCIACEVRYRFEDSPRKTSDEWEEISMTANNMRCAHIAAEFDKFLEEYHEN